MSGNGIADVSVSIQTKYDRAALVQAIQDFKDGKISADQLKQATDNLKQTVGVQNQAIRELSQSYRVQHYELLESIRVLSSFHSIMSDVNSVYQTFILRSIDANLAAQKEQTAFNDVEGSINDVLNAVAVLGDQNPQAVKDLKSFETQLDKLNSTDLTKVKQQIQDLIASGTLTPEQKKAAEDLLNYIDKLKDTKDLEDAKQKWQDFFTAFNSLFLIGASIPGVIAGLDRLKQMITKPSSSGGGGTAKGTGSTGSTEIPTSKATETLEPKPEEVAPEGRGISTAARGAGLLGLFVSIFGPSIVDTVLSAFGDKNAQARENQRQLSGQALQGQLSGQQTVAMDENGNLVPINSTSSQSKPDTYNINVDVGSIIANSEADLSKLGQIIADEIKKLKSQVTK